VGEQLDWIVSASRSTTRCVPRDVIDATATAAEIERETSAHPQDRPRRHGWARERSPASASRTTHGSPHARAELDGFLETESLAASEALAVRVEYFRWTDPSGTDGGATDPATPSPPAHPPALPPPALESACMPDCASGIELLDATHIAERARRRRLTEVTVVMAIAAKRGFASPDLADGSRSRQVRGNSACPGRSSTVPDLHEIDVATHVRCRPSSALTHAPSVSEST